MILKTLRYALTRDFRTPLHLTLFVTGGCDSACRACFNWRNLNRGEDLTFGEIERVSAFLRRLLWLHLSGGEPFLRDDLPEICRLFRVDNRAAYLAVPTNGWNTGRIVDLSDSISN